MRDLSAGTQCAITGQSIEVLFAFDGLGGPCGSGEAGAGCDSGRRDPPPSVQAYFPINEG